ncbi:hypothetical protein ACIRD2_06130 [Streptomyces sp. NPDC093595]|uniref:hypothetical protein n=1 Tax=Streptomyces sp. NPDC093595 TaxID=3366045 RepID=UPI0038164EAE
MELIQYIPELSAPLAPGEAIDHELSPVCGIAARRLAVDRPVAYSCAQALFGWVRDAVAHPSDAGRERLAFAMCSQSNVLDYPVLYAEPHPVAPNALRAAPDRVHLWQTLPTEL